VRIAGDSYLTAKGGSSRKAAWAEGCPPKITAADLDG